MLVTLVKGDLGDVKIAASCKDGSVLESNNIDDIIRFDNPSFRRIEALTISASSDYPKRDLASLDIQQEEFSTAKLRIDSTDDAQALHQKNEIVNRLKESKPSYDLFARFSVFTVFCALAWIPAFVVGGLALIGKIRPTDSHLSSAYVFNMIFFLGLTSFAVIYFIVERPRRWLFPRLHFLIGRQVQSATEKKKWRSIVLNSLLIGLVVGVIASVVAGILLHKWGQ